MASDADLATALSLVVGKDQYLEKSIDINAQRAELELEEYIARRLASGGSDEEILSELMASLQDDVSRIFGVYETGMRQTLTGAVNIASTNGATAEVLSGQSEDEFKSEKFRWTAAGKNICPDCKERHGRLETMETWITVGLPSQFGSRCAQYCQCVLLPETAPELSPIITGIAA